MQSRHDHGEAAARESRHGDAVLDGRELGGCRENSHVVQLVEQELLVLVPDWIVGGEGSQFVGELAEGLENEIR